MSRFVSVMAGYEAADVQRWMPPDVGVPVPLPEEPEIPLPTAEDVAAIEEAARVAGAEAGFKAGYQAGYREGWDLAKQEAEAERREREEREEQLRQRTERTLKETVAALEGVAHDLADPLASAADALEPELLMLTVSMARHVVMEELSINPELIQRVLARALAQLPVRHHAVRVSVHPQELSVLQAYAESRAENLTWLADPSIERGGCLVESGPSRIDARVQTRLSQAIEAIWGELRPPPVVPDNEPEEPPVLPDPAVMTVEPADAMPDADPQAEVLAEAEPPAVESESGEASWSDPEEQTA